MQMSTIPRAAVEFYGPDRAKFLGKGGGSKGPERAFPPRSACDA